MFKKLLVVAQRAFLEHMRFVRVDTSITVPTSAVSSEVRGSLRTQAFNSRF